MSATSAPVEEEYRPPRIVRWVGWLSEASGWLSAIALVAATLITTHAVVTRYFFKAPTIWQTESTIYLMMLVTFVGAAYGLKHHAHVGVDLAINALPQRPQLIMRIINALLCIGVVLVVFWTSFNNWQEAYLFNYKSATAFRFPLWIAYAILPMGMLLVALQFIAMIIEAVLGLMGKIPLSKVSMMSGTSELAQVMADLELEAALHEHDPPPHAGRRSTTDGSENQGERS
ncbi:MAG: TRAP transporter small permease [Ornithinimicrobium sp.]|uniref:TRAP transporter small permease subunit n=1 Tax=Ornithinimicrobium sp. TaxID=1977084 RepID=UPI0026DF789B|nr:TRAP transporter small permease [Ornithinimicrobium sp.]MDO5739644.1 TRAP transporter small permease [Ornithinimicrobium sp.]